MSVHNSYVFMIIKEVIVIIFFNLDYNIASPTNLKDEFNAEINIDNKNDNDNHPIGIPDPINISSDSQQDVITNHNDEIVQPIEMTKIKPKKHKSTKHAFNQIWIPESDVNQIKILSQNTQGLKIVIK